MIPKDHDLKTFFLLLHAMLRATPTSPDELTRSREVMMWAANHLGDIETTLDIDELRLFSHIMDHWNLCGEAPSRNTLEELVRRDNLPELRQDRAVLIDDYDQYLPHLRSIDAIEVLTVFRTRVKSWTKQQFMHMTHQARVIAESGLADSYRDPVDDARDFLYRELACLDAMFPSRPATTTTDPPAGEYYPELYVQEQLMEEEQHDDGDDLDDGDYLDDGDEIDADDETGEAGPR
jgi:hypothetical protein